MGPDYYDLTFYGKYAASLGAQRNGRKRATDDSTNLDAISIARLTHPWKLPQATQPKTLASLRTPMRILPATCKLQKVHQDVTWHLLEVAHLYLFVPSAKSKGVSDTQVRKAKWSLLNSQFDLKHYQHRHVGNMLWMPFREEQKAI